MKPLRSLRDYARCAGCGSLRHRSWFVKNKDGLNPCCGSSHVRSLAYQNHKNGTTTFRLTFWESVRYLLRII
ncbi:MAG: hypothetical protein E6R03_04355 [Hyphomicrobiaceae bacterium]|nr:MAG: hypothetical protein E6R03_04355 [Hyphomicrobiaceae bacterium]